MKIERHRVKSTFSYIYIFSVSVCSTYYSYMCINFLRDEYVEMFDQNTN